MNQSLREAVKRLFAEGKVKSVLGYREHPLSKCRGGNSHHPARGRGHPHFRRALRAESGPRITRDLPLPVGIVVKGCDGRAVSMRITEGDFAREQIVAIAVACAGVKADGKTWIERCQRCEVHVSPLADVAVGDVSALPKPEKTRAETIARIKAMTPAERFAFWQKAFEPCTHCYACREVCPLCNCTVCVTDQNAPRWIEQTAKPSSNLMWHMIRAFHHAGRCVDCGECQRACPEGVPMHLLDLCLAEDVQELFDSEPASSRAANGPSCFSTHRIPIAGWEDPTVADGMKVSRDSLLAALAKRGAIWAPNDAGRWTKVEALPDLGPVRPRRPVKDLFTPPRREIARWKAGAGPAEIQAAQPDESPGSAFGARPCDARALLLLDRAFLQAPHVDPHYKARRDNLLLVGVACQPAEHCYCGVFGLAPTTRTQSTSC